MLLQLSLILSVLLQFGSFFITIGLIPKTRFNASWIMVSIGFLLMALRRFVELIELYNTPLGKPVMILSNWMAVAISFLMFIGAFYILRIFQLQDKVDRERKNNEAKVLNAVIKTEEKERQRFSKELHDGLGPILSSIKMCNSALCNSVKSQEQQAIFSKTDQAIDQAILTIKEISNKLSPQILERYGLEKAIKTFLKELHIIDRYQIQMNIKLNKKRFDFNIELILYRIIGELINNSIKHASATAIDISLVLHAQNLQLMYGDNGIGFSPGSSPIQGMGLSNIRSRIKSLDGRLEISSKKNQGVFFKIKIPIS